MENLIERQKKALKLVENLVEIAPDQGTLSYALKMRERLKLPMSVVLDKLDEIYPGSSITWRSERLGITRQTYYGWASGIFRPDAKQAKKLAAITGYDVNEIRGQRPPRRRK